MKNLKIHGKGQGSGHSWQFLNHRSTGLIFFLLLLGSPAFVFAGFMPMSCPDIYYYHGMAFAQLGNWTQAEIAFQEGLLLAPNDKRLYQELAGVQFLQGNLKASKSSLEKALELDSTDPYTNEFLATIHLLEDNLEAAVQRWNNVGKPEINQIIIQPDPDVDPAVLDSAFAAAPASVLHYDDLIASQRRLEMLDVFPKFRIELRPHTKDEFDLVLHPLKRNTWKSAPYKKLLGMFRGVFSQTLRNEFYNLDGRTTNLASLFRWDKEKLRSKAILSMPFAGNAAHRISLFADWRKEEWDLTQSAQESLFKGEYLELTRTELGIVLQSQPKARWGWSNGISLSNRKFQNVPESLLPTPLFNDGWLMRYSASVRYDWLRLPHRRFALESSVNGSIAKTFSNSSSRFAAIDTETTAVWYPQTKGEDYLTTLQLSLSKGFGDFPFDELSIFGVKADTELLLRAHKEKERKGSNPMGTDYILLNFNIDKIVYSHSFLEWKLTPFIDTGNIRDPKNIFGSREWLIDAGLHSKFNLMKSFLLTFTYGKNLRNGDNVFFAGGSTDF